MKPSKSPENIEVTPSKKKLKQARLPFKLISEGSPTPITPQTRKRKLSDSDVETVSKIGKLSKENDSTENTVVISDDETAICDKSADTEQPKQLNPFVKLVDTAWKKKLQKRKKKKNVKKTKPVVNGSTEALNNDNENVDSKNAVETMDVDEPSLQGKYKNSNNNAQPVNSDSQNTSPKVKKFTPKRKSRKSRTSPRSTSKASGNDSASISYDIVVVEDSNSNTSDKSATTKDNVNKEDNESSSHEEITPKMENDSEKSNSAKNDQVTINRISEQVQNDSMTSKDDKDTADQNQIENTENDESDSVDEIAEEHMEDQKIPDPITPKRSSRNKAKVDEKEKQNKSKLDESISSNPSTPKQNRSLSVTTSLDDSLNESTASANLTPKQLQKKLEAAKKREEREKKRQQEKEEKAKQRQEREEQKKKEREEKEEVKRKEKEEKEEQRRKEKEEKDRQKEWEKKIKEEKEEQKRKEKEEKEEQKRKEKEEKEEQRRKEKEAREEERRKKQEAFEQEKLEQELKKKKAAEAFVNFFVPKQKSEKDHVSAGPVSKSSVLSSFAIKSDMRLAPTIRVNLSDEKKETLDGLMAKQNASNGSLYLKSLKEGTAKPLSGEKTWPLSDKDDDNDVMIVEDELPPIDGAGEIVTCETAAREKLRPKLLSFHKNRRPPYWGTWRKKSANVTPRRPFGQDKKYLDYEVDSDEEWEEEPEGESVDGSAAGSDDDDADEYEVDNELFVPHGYLSDEEATMDDDDVLSLSPETQKARLKHLEDEFESEMKKPTEKLKPRLYGILWETADGGKPENCVDALWNYFSKCSMIMNDPILIMQPSAEPQEAEKKKVKKKKVINDDEKQSPKNEKKKKKAKSENKDSKPKIDQKKNTPEVKKNQPGINSFLKKLKST